MKGRRIEDVMTCAAAARHLGITRQAVHAAVKKGRIDSVVISGIRFPLRSSLKNYALQGGHYPEAHPTSPAYSVHHAGSED